MARTRSKPNPNVRPNTIQRTYRFETKLYEAFEEDCLQHFSDPKRLIEAMIIHWLDASPAGRAAMIKKHHERIPRLPFQED
jgi:hypothetical protein